MADTIIEVSHGKSLIARTDVSELKSVLQSLVSMGILVKGYAIVNSLHHDWISTKSAIDGISLMLLGGNLPIKFRVNQICSAK